VIIEKKPAMMLPKANSGTRGRRSAHQPSPILAKMRRNPITDPRPRTVWMSMRRSLRMNGPA
jgi:hypothetical protein